MSATDGILGLLDILVKSRRIVTLNEIHTHSVEFLDTLPNLPVLFIVVGEVKALSPVAEVTRNYE